MVTDKVTRIDDLVHFALREWSRLSYSVSEAEVERAKAQLKASILLSLDGTTAVAEDIGRQIVTTGRRLSPEDVEKVVGGITAKDVMSFARRKLWDRDIAVSAVGQIEGLLVSLVSVCASYKHPFVNVSTGLPTYQERHEQERIDEESGRGGLSGAGKPSCPMQLDSLQDCAFRRMCCVQLVHSRRPKSVSFLRLLPRVCEFYEFRIIFKVLASVQSAKTFECFGGDFDVPP